MIARQLHAPWEILYALIALQTQNPIEPGEEITEGVGQFLSEQEKHTYNQQRIYKI